MSNEKISNEELNPPLRKGAVMRSFSLEDLRKAFEAGRTVENYKGEWQETYSDDCTSAKYDKFEDWLENYA
jgi:hypothetical protein